MGVVPTIAGAHRRGVRAGTLSSRALPVLEPRPGGVAGRFASALERRHPVTVFLAAAVVCYVLLATVTIAIGLLLTHVILHVGGIARADERFVTWLAAHRTATRTEASLIGSIMAGGVVLPLVVGLFCLVLALRKQWRIAAFLLTAIALEAATYRLTIAAVHRHRPRVARLEQLPVDASYYSGHTAASIAVYCSLVLLAASLIRRPWVRAFLWALGILVPVFVAFARMYRGMHHPIDSLVGVLVGIACVVAAVLAARAAGAAVSARGRRAA